MRVRSAGTGAGVDTRSPSSVDDVVVVVVEMLPGALEFGPTFSTCATIDTVVTVAGISQPAVPLDKSLLSTELGSLKPDMAMVANPVEPMAAVVPTPLVADRASTMIVRSGTWKNVTVPLTVVAVTVTLRSSDSLAVTVVSSVNGLDDPADLTKLIFSAFVPTQTVSSRESTISLLKEKIDRRMVLEPEARPELSTSSNDAVAKRKYDFGIARPFTLRLTSEGTSWNVVPDAENSIVCCNLLNVVADSVSNETAAGLVEGLTDGDIDGVGDIVRLGKVDEDGDIEPVGEVDGLDESDGVGDVVGLDVVDEEGGIEPAGDGDGLDKSVAETDGDGVLDEVRGTGDLDGTAVGDGVMEITGDIEASFETDGEAELLGMFHEETECVLLLERLTDGVTGIDCEGEADAVSDNVGVAEIEAEGNTEDELSGTEADTLTEWVVGTPSHIGMVADTDMVAGTVDEGDIVLDGAMLHKIVSGSPADISAEGDIEVDCDIVGDWVGTNSVKLVEAETEANGTDGVTLAERLPETGGCIEGEDDDGVDGEEDGGGAALDDVDGIDVGEGVPVTEGVGLTVVVTVVVAELLAMTVWENVGDGV